MQMIFSSIYGSYVNYKKRNLDFKDGVFVGIGD
ncbi:Integral membrane protein [Helicobacter pullorum]|uniref:Integral membrane protein n=1 Tax=Helicobacter pullorum TaxID=35818 RepID=A0A377Q125_9HELI|nr:Integral membrane protein [Helicobacter pullorum]